MQRPLLLTVDEAQRLLRVLCVHGDPCKLIPRLRDIIKQLSDDAERAAELATRANCGAYVPNDPETPYERQKREEKLEKRHEKRKQRLESLRSRIGTMSDEDKQAIMEALKKQKAI